MPEYSKPLHKQLSNCIMKIDYSENLKIIAK